MRLNREKYASEGSATLRESDLEIGDHGFILELVMKDMYSDPVKAICREIASNCRDAHREVGTPERPIKIVFPTALEQSITFKDWGPGISPDRMDTIYTKLGRSTKRDDNSETGGFGLGAKTPFAYTSQFSIITTSIISTQEEVDILNSSEDSSYTLDEVRGKHLKCLYTASRGSGSGGSGAVKLHCAELTDEETGTEVNVPLKKEDNSRFRASVIESCRYWDVKPEIVGDHEWPKERERVVEGTGWFIVNGSTHRWEHREQRAIIDGIGYPLDLNQVNGITPEAQRVLNAIRYSWIHMEFNTGDLELVPNREAILYDERTIRAISDRFDIIAKEVGIQVESKVRNASTYLEAVKIVRDFSSSVMDPGDMEWRGNKIYTRESVNVITQKTGFVDGSAVARLDTYTINKDTNAGYSKTNKSFLVFGRSLLINDVGKTVPRAYIEKYIADHGLKEEYPRNSLIIRPSFGVLVATDGDYEGLKDRIKEDLNLDLDACIEYEYLSNYAPPKEKGSTKTGRAKPKRGTSMVYEYDYTYSSWDSTRISRDEGEGVYVILSDRKSVIQDSVDGRNLSSYDLQNLIKFCELTKTKVYGVKAELVPKLGSGFVSLKEKVEAKRTGSVMTKERKEELALAWHRMRHYSQPDAISAIRSSGVKSKEIDKLLELEKRLNELKTEYTNAVELAHTFGDRSPFESIPTENKFDLSTKWDISEMAKTIADKYPLLEYINQWSHRHNKDLRVAIKEYVELVDSKDFSLGKAIKKAS